MKKQTARICLTLIGAIFLIFFIAPIRIWGITFNIGSFTGTVAGVLLILLGVFFNPIIKFFKSFTKKKAGKVLTGALLFCVFAPAFTALVLSCFMTAANLKRPSPDPSGKEPVLVVLGCHVIGRNPSLVLRERLEASLKYLKDHPDATCILSGGQGSDEAISEAECMYNWLCEHGIDKERLIKEDKSTSTRENLAFTYEILKERDLGNSIALVTNEFHMYRAMSVAKKLDLDTGAVPANTLFILLPTYVVREWYGILYEWLGLGGSGRVGI